MSPPSPNMDPLIRPEDILFKEPPKRRPGMRFGQRFSLVLITVFAACFSFVLAFAVTRFFRSESPATPPTAAPARQVEVLSPEGWEPVSQEAPSERIVPTPSPVATEVPAPARNEPLATPGTVIVVKQDDTLWGLLIEHYGKFSPELLSFVLRANPELVESEGERLNVGDQVIFPELASDSDLP